jgi:hypothetical protein
METEMINPVTGQAVTYRPLPDAEVRNLLPRILPAGWVVIPSLDFEGFYESSSLRVIFSAGIEEDGKKWAHVSVSRYDKTVPSWLDLVEVRDIFLGRERLAIQVLAPWSEHYTFGRGTEVLHLWAPLDGIPIPNFARARGGVL